MDPEPRALTSVQADLLVVLARLAATQVEREQRATEREALARLEGVTLTARELAHVLFNALTAPSVSVSRLARRADLPADARASLEAVRAGLAEAAGQVERLRQVVRVAIKPTPIGPSLDLDRAVQPDDGRSAA